MLWQRLVISRGLILTVSWDSTMTLSQQTALIDAALADNRASCAGMDDAATGKQSRTNQHYTIRFSIAEFIKDQQYRPTITNSYQSREAKKN